MKEEWKPVKGYEREYQISNLGRVKSNDRVITTGWGGQRTIGGMRKTINLNGRKFIVLSKNGKTKNFTVHRLVAKHFLPNEKGEDFVSTKNGDYTDTSLNNLEWKGKISAEIYQYDLELNFIKKWDNVDLILEEKSDLIRNSVLACCRGKIRAHDDFVWSYTKLSENEKNERIKLLKVVYQHDLNKNFIKLWRNANQAYISNPDKFNKTLITNNCKGKANYHAGHIWSYKKLKPEPPRVVVKTNHRLLPSVYQYTLSGELVCTWSSIEMLIKHNPFNIKRLNFKDGSINKSGYVWSYDQNKYGTLQDLDKLEEGVGTYNVFEYSQDLKLVRGYKSIKEAARMRRTNITSIDNCLRGRSLKHKGLIWSKTLLTQKDKILRKRKGFFLFKEVYQYDNDGELVCKWETIKLVTENVPNSTIFGIRSSCSGNTFSHVGYIWSLSDNIKSIFNEF